VQMCGCYDRGLILPLPVKRGDSGGPQTELATRANGEKSADGDTGNGVATAQCDSTATVVNSRDVVVPGEK
jgi:hypothetical protein